MQLIPNGELLDVHICINVLTNLTIYDYQLQTIDVQENGLDVGVKYINKLKKGKHTGFHMNI
jgi:hypothetical protein